jgi:hypothetical protein
MEKLYMPDIRSISEVFRNEESLANIRNYVKQADAVILFKEIFPDLKNIAVAVRLEKSILFLRVENSVWRNELRIRQKYIIERMNNRFGEQIIKSIKFIA